MPKTQTVVPVSTSVHGISASATEAMSSQCSEHHKLRSAISRANWSICWRAAIGMACPARSVRQEPSTKPLRSGKRPGRRVLLPLKRSRLLWLSRFVRSENKKHPGWNSCRPTPEANPRRARDARRPAAHFLRSTEARPRPQRIFPEPGMRAWPFCRVCSAPSRSLSRSWSSASDEIVLIVVWITVDGIAEDFFALAVSPDALRYLPAGTGRHRLCCPAAETCSAASSASAY